MGELSLRGPKELRTPEGQHWISPVWILLPTGMGRQEEPANSTSDAERLSGGPGSGSLSPWTFTA